MGGAQPIFRPGDRVWVRFTGKPNPVRGLVREIHAEIGLGFMYLVDTASEQVYVSETELWKDTSRP